MPSIYGNETTMSHESCEKILGHYVVMSTLPEEEMSRRLTERLSAEEQEVAARCSYAYWLMAIERPEFLTDKIRFAAAQREAKRHLYDIPEFEDSVRLLQDTVKFHRENKTTLYRTCMIKNYHYDDESDAKLAAERRARIQHNMEIQPMFLRGHDKQNNAIVSVYPRKESGDDKQGVLDLLIYIVERACACTEALSFGHREQMLIVVNTKDSCAPTIKTLKATVTVFENHYPGRLKNFVMLEPPSMLKYVYNVVKHFIHPTTRVRFLLLNGPKEKEVALSGLIDEAQATPNMRKGGKLEYAASNTRFLESVPFHIHYDQVTTKEIRSRKVGITARVLTLAVGSIAQERVVAERIFTHALI